jgi:hypothetical protein
MDKVDLSNLKVGDTVHLRCGGSIVVDDRFLRVAYTPDGQYIPNMEHHFDIISITPKPEPRRIKGWAYINKHNDISGLYNRKPASCDNFKALIYIDVAEGEGL